MRSHEKSDLSGQAPRSAWRYAFPGAGDGAWTFTVPADLVKCVGRYARIPEFAHRSHLLTCAPIGHATDMDADAAQRP